MPRVHQSTLAEWPLLWITSGAMYSSVPTNELVLKSFTTELVLIPLMTFFYGKKEENIRV